MEEDGAAAAESDAQSHLRMLGLRCALAAAVFAAGAGASSLYPFSADPATAHPLLCLKNALAQVGAGALLGAEAGRQAWTGAARHVAARLRPLRPLRAAAVDLQAGS